jgi:hypothetical protein
MKLSNAIRIISLVLLSGIITFTVTSCKNKNVNTGAPEINRETIKQEIKEYVYPVNSVFDVTKMLINIDASYIIGITNETANVEKYLTEQSKAYNLGVYITDMAYSITYNEKAEVKNFFKVAETLVNDLSLSSAFSKDLPNKIESNIDNKEKLVEIITKMSQDAYSYLNKQGRPELSYLILSGSLIEVLYLTCHLSETTYQNPEIVKTILFQKEPLLKVEKLLENGNKEFTKPVLTDIRNINTIYAESEGSNSVTKKQIEELTVLLEQIRKTNNQ